MPRSRRWSASGIVLLGACLAHTGWAAVTCNVGATNIAFGVYDPLTGTALDSTGTITVTCTLTPPPGNQNVNYTIELSAGNSGSYATRHMLNGTEQFNYNLYRDAARSQVWGNGSAGSFVVSSVLSLGPGAANRTRSATHTVFGRIPATQDVAPGNYSDTITVTVTY